MRRSKYTMVVVVAALTAGGLSLLAAGCSKSKIKSSLAQAKNEAETDEVWPGCGPDAEYKGGSEAWIKFLIGNCKYPDDAVNAEVQGVVPVRFVIERDGSVSNVQPLGGPGVLQKEAVRVISLSSGNWQPEMMNGRTVKSYKTQPIVFQLKAD